MKENTEKVSCPLCLTKLHRLLFDHATILSIFFVDPLYEALTIALGDPTMAHIHLPSVRRNGGRG